MSHSIVVCNSTLFEAITCVSIPTALAGQGQPTSKEQKLTADGAKAALLQMMRSDAAKDLGWFNGNVPNEMAKMTIEEEKDGWYAWTAAFRFNPSKALYTFVVRPQLGLRACTFEYRGSFVWKDGAWSAAAPKLVTTSLESGQ
jgi:hypothetical protein